MKALKWFSILAFTLIIIITSITQVNSQCNTMNDRFYIGVCNFLIREQYHHSPIWNWYNELNYNAMHGYSGHFDRDTLSYHDGGFFDARNVYESYIDQIISDWYTSQPLNSLLLEREKVLRGAYGQSSKYQAEDRDLNNVLCNSKAPGYGYDIHQIGRDSIDYWYNYNYTINPTYEYVKSRHCIPGDGSGYIVKQLFENCEQVNYTAYDIDLSNSSSRRLLSDIKYPGYRWFVKPRMRIDSVYAKTHLNDPVVSIITKNFGGVTIDSTVIYCINFLKYFPPYYYYNGGYLDRYYNMDKQDSSLSVVALFLADPTQHDYKGYTLNLDNSEVDYQVYWHGIVDVWLDYVRVDDEWAHYLFTNQDGHLGQDIDRWQFMSRINDEVGAFANEPGFGYFYTDESGYNTIPCIAEVNRLIRDTSNNSTALIAGINLDVILNKDMSGFKNMPNWDNTLEYLYSTGAVKDVLMYTIYPYTVNKPLPHSVTLPDKNLNPGTKRFYKSATNEIFNDTMNLQGIDYSCINYHRHASEFTKSHGLLYSLTMQVNSDQTSFALHPDDGWGEREPLTEEISVQCYLGMAYGAKRIIQYSYHSDGDSLYPGLGMENLNYSKRINNYYSYYNDSANKIDTLKKWYGVASINHDIKIIGDYMYPPGDNANHMVYDNTKTLNYTGYSLPYRYLNNINSYYSNNPTNNWDNPEVLYQDPSGKRYWEIGFFDKPGEIYSKYFMLVNKRCAPVINGLGDERTVRLYFDNSSLPDFNNWTLIDIKTGNRKVFNKNDANGVYFPFPFEPGEGKLFRLAPTMITGGDLVCNESFSGLTFTNDSTVNGNSYDITIGGGNVISFKKIGGIVMNGGTFKSGTKLSTGNVTLQGVNTWDGITLNNCTSVTIQKTEVKNISYMPGQEFLYGINVIGGNSNIITGCTFTNNNNAGFVNINVSDNSNSTSYITANTLNGESSSISINVISSGGTQNQVYIQGNYITSDNSPGSAIYLSNVTGGVVTNNVINNYSSGINLISSTVDLYGNYIFCNTVNSNAINIASSGTANLSPSRSESGTEYVGGNNVISYTGSGAGNIKTDNSYFYLDYGYNNFTIEDTNTFHLIGWFPSARYCSNNRTVYARDNCFYLNGNIVPRSNVTCGYNGSLVNFDYSSLSSSCLALNLDQNEVISLAEDINDTLWIKSTGTGGSVKEYSIGQAMALQVSSGYKDLKDSININLRRKNYSLVEEKCTRMLNTYPDSTFAIDALAKLYYSNLKLDNNGNKIGPLKSYYETLILNNSENYSLIMRANYFVQKSKVILKQYTSALQGFQEIINQNPYSYEGLVASWDYAATNLLANNSGGIKGDETYNLYNELSKENSITLNAMIDTLRNRKVNVNTYTNDIYDKSVFTAKDRETLKTNVENMYKNERTKQITKLQELEKQSKSDNETISQKSKSELKTMKTLGEVVKVKKPNTMSEHIKNINKDISKVLGVDKSNGNKKANKIIPETYSLSQNYPNPFNPVTKINFELPKDGRVKLVIYDVLGREMKSLVNNEFKSAGRYTVEFNGSQFASGVYFYRIQVEGGKGFTSVKKMVLVK